MRQPGIACTLVGARNEEQVKNNAEAVSFTLSLEDLDQVTSAANRFTLAEEMTV
jgi:aryl-alcohol dehydrogenase-like predicted oxidoreductase